MTGRGENGVEVGFRPRAHGFHFPNSWPRGAPGTLAGFTLGRVYGGLCGGMCVLAARAFEQGTGLPQDRAVPADGTLTSQLWQAQLASMDLPDGPLRYLRLQLPTAAAARRRSSLADAIPAVRRSLQSGRPALLGLVRATSWSPAALGRHHIVLSYALRVRRLTPDLPAEGVELRVYDPNLPDDDSVVLVVAPDGSVRHTRSELPVHALVALG